MKEKRAVFDSIFWNNLIFYYKDQRSFEHHTQTTDKLLYCRTHKENSTTALTKIKDHPTTILTLIKDHSIPYLIAHDPISLLAKLAQALDSFRDV